MSQYKRSQVDTCLWNILRADSAEQDAPVTFRARVKKLLDLDRQMYQQKLENEGRAALVSMMNSREGRLGRAFRGIPCVHARRCSRNVECRIQTGGDSRLSPALPPADQDEVRVGPQNGRDGRRHVLAGSGKRLSSTPMAGSRRGAFRARLHDHRPDRASGGNSGNHPQTLFFPRVCRGCWRARSNVRTPPPNPASGSPDRDRGSHCPNSFALARVPSPPARSILPLVRSKSMHKPSNVRN